MRGDCSLVTFSSSKICIYYIDRQAASKIGLLSHQGPGCNKNSPPHFYLYWGALHESHVCHIVQRQACLKFRIIPQRIALVKRPQHGNDNSSPEARQQRSRAPRILQRHALRHPPRSHKGTADGQQGGG